MEPLSAEYVKVGKVEEGERERGNPRMSRRDECEMIMMIGLPGSGKTYWVDQYVADHPDKQYNVIGTNTMINKMTVNGEPRKGHHKGKWEQVVQKATRSLQEMLRAASQRRRNVIIDQTNVYPSAQKRKARPFEGFQRRAVVVVPNDETYKERVAAQTAAGNKDIPDEAIMEMKANYALPEDESDAVVPMFKDVVFTDLNREEAVKVVELYNKIAKEKGYGKKHEERKMKKFKGGNQRGGFKGKDGGRNNTQGRNNNRPNNRPMRGMRGGRGGGPPMRGGPWMRGRGGPMGPGPMARGGMMNRGGPGPMGPSPWSQGGNNMGGGPMRSNMGGGGGPQGWGPWNQGGGNMNNMGQRGMGGGGPMFGGNNQGNNFGGGMGGGMGNQMGMGMGGGNMGGGMGMGNQMGGMTSNMGGGMGGMGNQMGGGMRPNFGNKL